MSPTWMVARRELKVRLMNKASVISLVVMVGLIAIGTGVGYYFQHRDSTPPQITVGVDAQASALDPALSAAAKQQGVDLTVTATTEAKGRAAVTDGTLAGLLLGDPGAPRLLVADKPDQSMLCVVSAAVRTYVVTTQITDLGGNPTTFEQALAAASPQVDAIAPSGAAFDDAAFGVAMVMIAVLFGTLVATGSMIAMGVVEEKTSRVVEVLLATIRPSQLFTGKVLGVGLYGLFQVLVLGTAGDDRGCGAGGGEPAARPDRRRTAVAGAVVPARLPGLRAAVRWVRRTGLTAGGDRVRHDAADVPAAHPVLRDHVPGPERPGEHAGPGAVAAAVLRAVHDAGAQRDGCRAGLGDGAGDRSRARHDPGAHLAGVPRVPPWRAAHRWPDEALGGAEVPAACGTRGEGA